MTHSNGHSGARPARTETPLTLAGLREYRGFTPARLAEALGLEVDELTRLEQADDIYLSTLQQLVKAMKGNLEFFARLPEGAIRITPPEPELDPMGRPDELYISRLRHVIAVMGGPLKLVAHFAEGDVHITQFEA